MTEDDASTLSERISASGGGAPVDRALMTWRARVVMASVDQRMPIDSHQSTRACGSLVSFARSRNRARYMLRSAWRLSVVALDGSRCWCLR
ncbi:hypothetical protein GCM10010377_69170 [Streptomyces viridiviolaceus]|nr:hypothetical protein GCM10010377_69170 [Streptomyces viridiviolaceus]